MRPEDLREFNRREPFMPYRIHITGGKTYEVHHPDQVIVLRSRIAVGVGENSGIPERLEHVALLHILRIEELATEITAG
jgi:hypothetical protein